MDQPHTPSESDTDRGYAPGGGYSDNAPFPEDEYRWRATPKHGYGSQDEFTRHPEDEFRRSAGGGVRDRAGVQRTRARSWHGNAEGHAQAGPHIASEPSIDGEDVGDRRRAYRDH